MAELLIPIADIEFDPGNLHEHNDLNVSTIATSLKKFGQWEPLIVRSNGRLVAGEGRILAVQNDAELSWTHVAAIVFDGPEQDARDLSTLMIRAPELATWDRENLVAYLEQARQDEADLLALGWREDDVRSLLASVGKLGDAEAVFLENFTDGEGGAQDMMHTGGLQAEPEARRLEFPASEDERREVLARLRELQQRWSTATLTATLLEALRRVKDSDSL